jgi:hypothetical protein
MGSSSSAEKKQSSPSNDPSNQDAHKGSFSKTHKAELHHRREEDARHPGHQEQAAAHAEEPTSHVHHEYENHRPPPLVIKK